MPAKEAEVVGQATTRELIPVVALRLFAAQGYAATSMRQIAEELEITKAALYYHFESKEDIVRAFLADARDQVAQLVEWARTQKPGHALRLEVLQRWSSIMQAQGLALFRFVIADATVFREAKSHTGDMTSLIRELNDILTPPGASVEEQLRTRLALMSINMAGIAGVGMDANEDEILHAARRIAAQLLPRET